jgi:hypothetical protein
MTSNGIRLQIERRMGFAEGTSFGETGPYEHLQGKVYFAVNPGDPSLPFIADLDLAPRNPDGRVEFACDLDILKPVDLGRGNRRILYEFSNRGGRGAMRYNDGGTGEVGSATWAGNGFLMRQGYTVVWSGWQGDLVSTGKNIVAYLPQALEDGKPVRGRVRQEFIADTEGVLSLPVSGGAVIECYPVLDRATATLTRRRLEQDPRVPVPDAEWELARAQRSNGSVQLTPSNVDLYIKGGFQPGWIYELIYDTEGSRVMNLGFAGVRELISFLHHGAEDDAGTTNPLAGAIDRVFAYGSSLSGRVIREFVYEGWNADTQGRRVFDGVQSHTGSGRLFMNHRFAQVGRYPRQHEEHSWAAERYPFTFVPVPDPFTEKVDALLKHPETDPLIMHTHTSTEYWQRHGSLNHTDCRDGSDVEIPESTRMYWLAGAPHGPAAMSPRWIGEAQPNGISPGPMLRACLVLLDRWATDGTPPPATRLPSQTDRSLAEPAAVLQQYPRIPGLRLPASASQLPFFNYGPDFDRGLLTVLPPESRPGEVYPVQVPAVDADGNDLAGLRYPDIEVPLGTYTGWAVRKPDFGGPDLLSNSGSFVPFARTRAEREAAGDPRPSIEERYPSHDAYVAAVMRVTEGLVKDRLLLQEDAERFVQAARQRNPLDPAITLGPLLSGAAE